MISKKLILLLLLVACTTVSATTCLTISDMITKLSLNKSITFFEDSTSIITLDFARILLKDGNFCPHSGHIPNKGFTNSTIWLNAQLIDSSTISRDFVVDIAMPALHYVEFFILSNDSLLVSGKSGFAYNKNKRATPFRNPSIKFTSSPGSKLSIFIKVKSENPVITPVAIREENTYLIYDRNREFFYGLYFGALLILALYHLHLSFTTRDINYLWLTLFTICFGAGQMTAIYGYLSDVGFTEPSYYLQRLHIINYLAAFFGIYLTRGIIQSSIYTPKSDFIIRMTQYLPLFLSIISPFITFMTAEKLLMLPNFLPLPFFIYSAVKAHKKGYRPAAFYLTATTIFLAGMVFYNLTYAFNVFPYFEFTYFIVNITFTITLTLFSLSLADKINILKHEEAKAREQALFELGEKVKAQDEKALIERELEQSRKMEAIGRLLSGIAHDMKNFLSPILGYAVLMRKQAKNDSGITDTSEKLVTATQRLNDLAMTLVNVSRKNAPGTELLSINNLISQTASLLKHSSPSHINIKVQLSPTDYSISANPGMIHSALLNLGVNAVDAMPDGGKVTITSSTESLDTNHPACSKFGVNGGIFSVITFSDTGIGIDSRDLDYIFEPFFTKNKSGKGTGLGLTGVYNCVKVHGGCLDVQSEVGKGTTFRLYFPVREVPHPQSSSPTEIEEGV